MPKTLTVRVTGERASGKTLLLGHIYQFLVSAGYQKLGDRGCNDNSFEELFFDGEPKGIANLLKQQPVPVDVAVSNIINQIKSAMRNGGLPDGHAIIESAELHDGSDMVAQTVLITATGKEYVRTVHTEEAYGV